ncbi:MAG: sugar ABC transporter permease [Clostridiaceae bacterium]|nr:sugar ABC transporter permease [Clostridiaceae bacterium]
MQYIDYVTLPWYKKIVVRLTKAAKNLGHNFVALISKIGKFLISAFTGIVGGIKYFFSTFWKGDIRTKLSYLFMGSGCLLRGQIVRGLAFLALQMFYIVYMVSFGWGQLKLFPTLGTATKKEIWDEVNQIYLYEQGDNSMLILLFSVLTIAISIVMFYLYFRNIRMAYENQQLLKAGKKLNTIVDDAREFLDKKLHVTFLSLPTLGVIFFTALPLIFMILIAFTNYDKNHQPPGSLFTWVGLENFRNILSGRDVLATTFKGVLAWTIIWAIFATFSNYILGMLLALMINKKGIKFKSMWRTIFVITIAVPQFVTLLLMSRLLDDRGAVNILLGYLGMGPVKFLTDAAIARVTVIVVNIWVGVPYTMLITTGILMNIPAELYESARIDGAGPYKTFTKITLPYMLFVTTPYLITQFVSNINNFNVIFLLSGGNPLALDYYQAGKTDLLVTWLYKLTVNYQDYNLASTIGIMIFVISAAASLIVYNSSSSAKKEGMFQ